MMRIPRSATQLVFDRDIPPVAEVEPGERVVVETADSLCGLVKSQRDVFAHIDEVFDRLGGACPVTGPLYVRGARPGWGVAMTLHSIVPAPVTGTGWTAVIPGWGAWSQARASTFHPRLARVPPCCGSAPAGPALRWDGVE